jgi:C-1 hydroxylase
MSPEANKALLRQWVESFNERNMEAFYTAIAPNCVFPTLAQYGLPPTLEGYQQILSHYMAGFPDAHVTIEEQIAEGDTAMNRNTEAGTHTGTWRGISATNKPVAFTSLVIFRLRDGKIVEWRYYPDLLSLLQQVGALPS